MTRAMKGMVAAVLVAAGCYRPKDFHAPPVAPNAKVGVERVMDSTRVFLDSLAGARARDSVRPAFPAPATIRADAIGDLAWLDVLNDTVLTGLVRRAVAQNRDVALARARIDEYRANIGIARAPLRPRVSGNGSIGTSQVVFGGGAPIQSDAYRLTADVAWELDFWGRYRYGVTAATADAAAQDAAQRAAVLSLVSDVAVGYLQLLELDEEREIATRTLSSRRALLSLAQERFNQGVVSELDVKQFEAQLAIPIARLAQIERQRSQQEHALNLLMGETPVRLQRGGSLVLASRAVIVPDSLPASLLDRRPDVAQAERAFAAASARAGVVTAARLPSIAITGFYGTQSSALDRIFGSNTNVYQVQAGISVPIYSGGRDRHEQNAARARVEQSKAIYERTALNAIREAGDALVGVRTARDEVTANETLVSALRRAVELSEARYQSGVASFLEVLDAQRGLFDAELVLSQSRLRELVSAVQVYRALGGSWR